MDHPGALRHAADREAVALSADRLGAGVGRHDRLGRGRASVVGELRRSVAQAHEEPVERMAARR